MGVLKRYAVLLCYSLYGLYAVAICVVCLVVGGTLAVMARRLKTRRVIVRTTLQIMFFMAAMPYRVDGLKRLPDGPSIVIANHRSYLDGFILLAALPPRFSPVIKHEIAEIPFIGWFLKHVGARFVAREPAARAGGDTLALLGAIESGESLAIFPEGTFSTDVGLLPFRGGAFFLAAKANVPIVPLAIEGTRIILPEIRVLPWPGTLRVRIFDAVTADGTEREDAVRLRDRVETMLAEQLEPQAPVRPENTPSLEYYRKVLAGRTLPLAFVDLDVMERNLRAILQSNGNKPLRLDARAMPCTVILQRVMRSNARFHGVICATVDEAIGLAGVHNLADVLVAYPTVQTEVLARACAAIAGAHALTLTVDATSHVQALAAAATKVRVIVPVCVEIDMSVSGPALEGPGRRSAIRTIEDLVKLVTIIDEYPELRFRGVLTYDNQRNHLAEWLASEGSQIDTSLSARNAQRLNERRHALAEALRVAGHGDALVNCGGAGRMVFNAAHSAVTEITVGALLFGLDPEDPSDTPAAVCATEIIRQPGPDLYACLGIGGGSPRLDDPMLLPRPYLPHGARLDGLYGVGEGQLPIRYAGRLKIGDMVFLRPTTMRELCMYFDRLHLIQAGAVVDEVSTYRV